MDTTIQKRTTNLIELEAKITHDRDKNGGTMQHTSPPYSFGTVNFQLQIDSFNGSFTNQVVYVVLARYLKAVENDNLLYKCSVKLFDKNKKPETEVNFTEHERWHLIFRGPKTFPPPSSNLLYSFHVTVQFDLEKSLTPFASLYEDTELTDFTLKGENGSVSVHSAILAVVSPVLKNMLTGNWQETSNRSVTIADVVTKETLEHFKEYMYQDKLPETGLDKLLLLGSCYLITDLVRKCEVKILFTMTSDNICEYIEFAVRNKLDDLLAFILKTVDNKAVDMDKLLTGCWKNALQTPGAVVNE